MRLTNRAYDILKYINRYLGAVSILYVALAAIWGWPYANEISKTCAAVSAFLAAILEVSTVAYKHDLNSIRDDEPNEDIVDHEKKDE